MQKHQKDNPVLSLSLEFALLIIEYCEDLKERHHFAIHNQLIRSGKAIGALVREAQSPESRKDFIHKLKIAMKEA